MQSVKAPFRADHVGSLLRPAAVKRARQESLEQAKQDESRLRQIEDTAIEAAVTMQQECGLLAVTDGEYRRSFWHYDFMGALDGFELVEKDEGVQFAGVKLPPVYPTITGTGPLSLSGRHRSGTAKNIDPGTELLPLSNCT